jgi:hypothetical protein
MIVVGYDTTHALIASLPAGALAAGYTTGSPDIAWTAQDWAAHPHALRICQDWDVSADISTQDPDLLAIITSDYLDTESGAAVPADAPGWYKQALACYKAGTRPGQRLPGFYMSANSVTDVVNHLVSGGVTSGPVLIVADWNLSEPQAVADVYNASGPFPIRGVQFRDPGPYDIDVYDSAWLNAVSGTVTPPAPHGPYLQVADGSDSLATIAAERHGNAENLGELNQDMLMSLILPKGTRYRTFNP